MSLSIDVNTDIGAIKTSRLQRRSPLSGDVHGARVGCESIPQSKNDAAQMESKNGRMSASMAKLVAHGRADAIGDSRHANEQAEPHGNKRHETKEASRQSGDGRWKGHDNSK